LRIKLDLEDAAPTLLLIDLVRFDDPPGHGCAQIRDEVIVVHDRARSSTCLTISAGSSSGWARRAAVSPGAAATVTCLEARDHAATQFADRAVA
jgi:hypothetical protein